MTFKAEVVVDDSRLTLRLAGRLDLEQSSELAHICEQAHGAVRLDLTDLLSADAAGFETLRMLRSRGAVLLGLSPYLTLRLEAEPSERTRKQ